MTCCARTASKGGRREVSACRRILVLHRGALSWLAALGWGVRDPPEYFSLAPRLGYALLVAAFGLAVGVQALGGTEGIRAGAGEEGKPVPRQHVVRAVMVLLLY